MLLIRKPALSAGGWCLHHSSSTSIKAQQTTTMDSEWYWILQIVIDMKQHHWLDPFLPDRLEFYGFSLHIPYLSISILSTPWYLSPFLLLRTHGMSVAEEAPKTYHGMDERSTFQVNNLQISTIRYISAPCTKAVNMYKIYKCENKEHLYMAKHGNMTHLPLCSGYVLPKQKTWSWFSQAHKAGPGSSWRFSKAPAWLS